ncbi:hypothetical protein ACIPPJ_31895 [Streptomyces sp. NPDC086091]|uniref:hypothetical protein n=1 Tax=Streptomyces sp. NPDC086091 TaxID=3365751 RepID=UPI003811D0DE
MASPIMAEPCGAAAVTAEAAVIRPRRYGSGGQARYGAGLPADRSATARRRSAAAQTAKATADSP